MSSVYSQERATQAEIKVASIDAEIKATVRAYKKFNGTFEDAVEDIMRADSLVQDDAEAMVAEYWK